MVLDDPQAAVVNNEEDDFAKHFEEFASGSKVPDPAPEAPPSEEPSSEGNDPEEPKVGGDEPPADEPPAGVTSDPPAGDPKPPAEPAPDPWANVPPELKAQFDQLQRERDEARHKASSDAKRVSALSRKLNELERSATPAPPPQQEQRSEGQKALDEKISKLREEYPDVAGPLIEALQAQRDELTEVRSRMESVTQDRQAAYIEQEQAALDARHPDWRDIAADPSFAEWIESQPEGIQRLATSWDAQETSVALTLYKAERMAPTSQGTAAPPAPPAAPAPEAAATDARRSQQLEGGRDVRSRPAPASSGPPEDFEAAFAYFAERAENKKRASAR